MQDSRTFRIFVSSTFSDLEEERKALQERVFPKLRDLAASYRCRFQAIDLRWGVSDEAALDQQTMKICLGEIARCQKTSPRPNFIVLLGNRYGWRPIPSEIPADEFERITPLVVEDEKGLLDRWYRRDDNAVPAVYLLQPRTGEFVENEHWEKVEATLRQAFLSAVGRLSLPLDALLKYSASATEQEIVAGALRVPDANEHVFCFLRDITGMPDDGSAARFQENDPEAVQKQAELREHLKKQLPGNVHDEYTAQWQNKGPSLKHLDQLCDDVYTELSKVIEAEGKLLKTVELLEREIAAHETFGKDRARVFVGRADTLKELGNYIAGNDPHPLAIWGVSGSGKSALMAKAVEQAQQRGQDVLCRFIGATPDSSNGRALLESLCHQISRRYRADESAVPSEYKDLVQEFPKCLALAKTGKPLVIFLDGLDQLSDYDNARNLVWLPAELPPNVRLIVSTLPGECLEALESKSPAQCRLEVQPMSVEDGKALLDTWFAGVNRKLQDKQERFLLDKFKHCGLPLYLKLAFEEARLWKSNSPLLELSGDIPGILRDLFKRLSLESNHGGMLLARSLGYLAAGKNGLSEDELLDVLSMDPDVLADFRRRSPKSPKSDRLPAVVWSRLYFELEPYLAERRADGTSLLGFYHRQLGEAVTAAYLASQDKSKRHQTLAEYFQEQPLVTKHLDKKTPNLRKLSEQPYQLVKAREWNKAYGTLTDFDFLEAKCRTCPVYDLVTDFQMALGNWQGEESHRQVLTAFEERLRLESHNIEKYPELLFPQLYNHLSWLDAPDGPLHSICERGRVNRRGWLRGVQDPRPTALLASSPLQAHGQPLTAIAFSPDGNKIISGSKDAIKVWDFQTNQLIRSIDIDAYAMSMLKVSPDGKTILSSFKGVRIWDLQTGQLLQVFDTGAQAAAYGSDGKSILSVDYQMIIVWDIETGRKIQSIQFDDTKRETRGPISHLVFSPDLKTGIRSSQKDVYDENSAIELWDLLTGQLCCSCEGHTSWVSSLAFSADGKTAISNDSQTVKLWDTKTGKLVRSFDGHGAVGKINIIRTAISPDGIIILYYNNKKMEAWDLRTGQYLHSFEWPSSDSRFLESVAVSPDGNWVVGGSEDGSIKLWDFRTGKLLRYLSKGINESGTIATSARKIHRSVDSGRGFQILAVNISPDCKTVLSCSFDIQQWDIETGQWLRSLEGHAQPSSVPTDSIAISSDGRTAISTDWENTSAVYDLQIGRLLHSVKGNDHWTYKIAIHPDGKTLLSSSLGNTLERLDIVYKGRNLPYQGHIKPINALAISLDGKNVISGSEDKSIKIWDFESGKMLRSLEGHAGPVNSVALSPDGKFVCSGSDDKTIKTWDIHGGKPLRSFNGHVGPVNSIAISPNGKNVISGSEDKSIKIWDFKSGKPLRSLHGHVGPVNSIAVSPGGKIVISGSEDKSIKIWDFQSGKLLRSLEGHASPVNSVAISPDGKFVCSGSADKTIKIWDVEIGKLIRSIDLYFSVHSVAYSLDGKSVFSGAANYYAAQHDTQTGQKLASWSGATFQLRGKAVISRDGKFAITRADDNSLRLWAVQTGKLVRSFIGHTDWVTDWAISLDGKNVISCSKDGAIKRWDMHTGQMLQSIEGMVIQGARHYWALSSDGNTIISSSQVDSSLEIRDFRNRVLLHSHTGPPIYISPSGRTAIIQDAPCYVLDLQTGKKDNLQDNTLLFANKDWGLITTPDDSTAISVSSNDEKCVKIVDLRSGKAQAAFADEVEITSLGLSRDLRWLVCGDKAGKVWIFEWVR